MSGMSEMDARLQAMEARISALGQFSSYLMGRLGADDDAVEAWWHAWQGGNITRLLGVQIKIINTLKPKKTGGAVESAPKKTAG